MRTERTPTGLWLRPCNATTQPPAMRLVCLPYAGGTAHAYSSWPTLLPADVGVYGLQYPGRQDRFAEPLVDDIGQLVGPIATAMRQFIGEPLVLFGHSMGAFVAYEVTVELERRHGRVVDLLVVSGAPPPHRKAHGRPHEFSNAELIADVRRINQSFTDILDEPALLDVLLPMIRADYRLSETYVRRDPLPVHAGLVAVGGDHDPAVSRDELEAWSAFAGTGFEALTLPGGHFYLFDDQATLTRSLAARLPERRPGRPLANAAESGRERTR